jgi:GDP/UDP-N,N'-diacetylbacillosamine 2-epimerase (hydrolysing)
MSRGKLRVCIVTGSRAEYGLFYPLLMLLKKDKQIELQIIVTGMHLSPEFGLTWKQIQSDGFTINKKVDMLLSADTDTAIIKSTGIGLMGMADALEQLRPDWIILIGDRFETFAAAVAAHLAKIPVAHLHGGEVTEGATDDAMRHAITKMAYLHFTATESYRKRVIQLGEDPSKVFATGAIGLDNGGHMLLLSKEQLSKNLGFVINDNTVLVTYHPVTLEKDTSEKQMKQLLKALDAFPDIRIIFTLPNADANGRVIIKLINEYVTKRTSSSCAFTSLGQLRYLSCLQYVKAVIGNSSSGIIEVPYFKKPTVNIGDRQKGRIKAASIIDTGTDTRSIISGIRRAFSPAFMAVCNKTISHYGSGNASSQIAKIIKRTGRLSSLKKSFFDLL